ncbi:Hypothetical predicted protein, partial [Marmota monax]
HVGPGDKELYLSKKKHRCFCIIKFTTNTAGKVVPGSMVMLKTMVCTRADHSAGTEKDVEWSLE